MTNTQTVYPLQNTAWIPLGRNIRQSDQVIERRCAICEEWKSADFSHFPCNLRNYAQTHQVCLDCVPRLHFDNVRAEFDELYIDEHIRPWRDLTTLKNDCILDEACVGIIVRDKGKHEYVVVDYEDWNWLRQYPGEIIVKPAGQRRYAYLKADDLQGMTVPWPPKALHTMIAKTGNGELTVHLNGEGRDNRRVNVLASPVVL